jgi:hypothetical protein
MTGVHERCVYSLIRETLILLSEAINVEKRYGVRFQPTEEEIQHTSHT